MRTMYKESGFSLMELMLVISMIALITAIAMPSMLGWREGAKLRGTVENLRGDLQLAKLKAVQESGPVAISFSSDGYQVFIDTGANEGARDAGERLIKNRELPEGVSIDLANTDFNGKEYARFNNRGLPEDTGDVMVDSSGGEQRLISLNRLGRISITE